jgi:hypothetical protein
MPLEKTYLVKDQEKKFNLIQSYIFVSVVILSLTMTEAGDFKLKKFTDFSRNFFIIFLWWQIYGFTDGRAFSIRGVGFVNELGLQSFPPATLEPL